MRISILAIGRLSRDPAAALARDYAERASATGRSLGLGPVDIIEVEARRSGKPAEAEALIAALGPEPSYLIACDERGRAYPSRTFAENIGRLRDRGERRLVFLIGGADGLAPDLVAKARETLAFGPQTWPHALARAMLAEQIYRATTILAGGPYHRD